MARVEGNVVKRAVVVIDVAAGTCSVHEPLLNPGKGDKWLPGAALVTANVFKDYDTQIQRMLTLHGAKQKLCDRFAAIGTTGITVRDAVMEVHENLLAGNWEGQRESRAPGTRAPELFTAAERNEFNLQAYANCIKKPVDYVRDRVNAILAGTDETKKASVIASRASPQVMLEAGKLMAAAIAARPKPEKGVPPVALENLEV